MTTGRTYFIAVAMLIVTQCIASSRNSASPHSLASVDTVRFGTLICVTTRTLSYIVRNPNSNPVNIAAATIAGGNQSEFRIIFPTSFPVSIKAVDSLALQIEFAALAPGSTVDTLNIAINDPIQGQSLIKVILIGHEERSAMSIPGSLLLSTLSAGSIRDTFAVFVSTGSLVDTIMSVANISGPQWITYQSPALPRTVANTSPNNTVQLSFHIIAPQDTGWFTTIFRVHVEPCGLDSDISIHVYVTAPIARVVSSINAGTLFCGPSKCLSEVVYNTGNAPLHVSALNVQGMDASDISTPTPAPPYVIPPYDSQIIQLCIHPHAAGIGGASIEIVSDDSVSPAHSAVTQLHWVNASAGLVVPASTVDIGNTHPGTQRCADFFITNSGAIADTITDIVLASGSSVFTIASPAFPFSIAAGDSAKITLCFSPLDTITYNARFRIITTTCDSLQTVAVSGSGWTPCAPSILLAASTINIGSTLPGKELCADFFVKNISAIPDTITNVALASGSSAFTIPAAEFPLHIAAGDSAKITICFSPIDTISYAANFRVFTSTCDSFQLLSVAGVALSKCNPSIALSLPALGANVGDHISVPLTIASSQHLNACGAARYIWRIRFRRSVLFPLDAATSSVDSGNDRIVTFSGTRSDTSGALATLHFIAALGDTNASPLHVESFVWTDTTMPTTTTDGSVQLLDVCMAGGARLISTTGKLALSQNSPNPFSNETQIFYQTIERGNVSLRIVDILGRTVAVLVDDDLPPGNYQAMFHGEMFPDGFYNCILQTPTMRQSISLIKSR